MILDLLDALFELDIFCNLVVLLLLPLLVVRWIYYMMISASRQMSYGIPYSGACTHMADLIPPHS